MLRPAAGGTGRGVAGRLRGRAQRTVTTSIPIPGSIRMLIDGPNYAHLSTLRADGSPRNWVVWVAREGDNVLVCTNAETPKARDMRRDSRVGLSIAALDNPYRMATLRGRVIGVRDDATLGLSPDIGQS